MVDLTILNHSPTFTAAVSSSFRAGVVWVWVLAGGCTSRWCRQAGERPGAGGGAWRAASRSMASGLAEHGRRRI